MSRARELLIIIGDLKTLQRDNDWNQVIQKADIVNEPLMNQVEKKVPKKMKRQKKEEKKQNKDIG